MKILLVSFYCLLLFACTPGTSSEVEVAKAAGINTPATAEAPNAKQDSIPPIRRPRTVMDTSRPVSKMKTDFPFDIDVSTPTGEKRNSATAILTKGKPTILLFWLTTCYPCRMELAAIKKNYAAWQAETDFNLFAISTDFSVNYERFQTMVKKNEWPFPAFHDTNREFRKVMPGGLNGLPQVFVLNAEGEVVMHKRKYQSGDEHKLYAKVKELAGQ